MPSRSADGGAGPQPARHGLSPWLVAAVAVLAGLAAGQFLVFDGAEPRSSASPRPSTDREPAEQVAALERRVAENPNDVSAWRQLGVSAVQRAAETGDPSFYDVAAQALDRAAELDGNSPETQIIRGRLALARHEFAEARRLGESAADRRPADGEALGVVADAEIELGRYEAAAQTVQEMLDVEPGLPALARTSYLRELHGDLPGATTAMQQALTAGSGSAFQRASIATLLGDLYRTRGDLSAARDAYERALAESDTHVRAEAGLARVEAARGDLDGALERLEPLVEQFPHPEVATLLAELQSAAGHPEEAAATDEVVRTITALQAEAGQTVDLELALFEADRGDSARAVELARAAHEARSGNVYANDALAWALVRDGRAEEALAHVERALRLDTADPVIRFHAAAAFAASGEHDRAAEELARALETNAWFTFQHRDRVRELAATLNVTLPAEWHDDRRSQ